MKLKEVDEFIIRCKEQNIDIPEDIIAKIDHNDYIKNVPEDMWKIGDLEYNTTGGRIKIIDKNNKL